MALRPDDSTASARLLRAARRRAVSRRPRAARRAAHPHRDRPDEPQVTAAPAAAADLTIHATDPAMPRPPAKTGLEPTRDPVLAPPSGTGRTRPQSLGDRNIARLLALLEADRGATLTVAELLDGGVQAPAQAVYALQLAGYDVERGYCRHPDGHKTLGYRMRAPSAAVTNRHADLPKTGCDDSSR